MFLFRFIAIIGGACALLYSSTSAFNGIWNGGGQEVYTDGNEHYCLLSDSGSSASFSLNATGTTCIYLTLGSVIASQCGSKPNLSVSGLNNKMYKVVVAPSTVSTNKSYTLTSTYSGTFDRCADYYEAGYLGMTVDHVNMLLGIAGLITAILLLAPITYILLTLGNF